MLRFFSNGMKESLSLYEVEGACFTAFQVKPAGFRRGSKLQKYN